MTEGARNAANIVVVGLALLLSCCTNERETKALLGVAAPNAGQTPGTEAERDALPVNNMVSILAANNSMTV